MATIDYTIRIPADLDFAIGAVRAAKAAGIGLPEPLNLVGYDNQQFLQDFVIANATRWANRLTYRVGQLAGVPLSVAAASAVIVLRRRGLKDTVEGGIAAIPDAAERGEMQDWYDRSATFERYSPAVLKMQAMFLAAGDARWTDEFLDQLWIEADQVQDDAAPTVRIEEPAPAPTPAPTEAPVRRIGMAP